MSSSVPSPRNFGELEEHVARHSLMFATAIVHLVSGLGRDGKLRRPQSRSSAITSGTPTNPITKSPSLMTMLARLGVAKQAGGDTQFRQHEPLPIRRCPEAMKRRIDGRRCRAQLGMEPASLPAAPPAKRSRTAGTPASRPSARAHPPGDRPESPVYRQPLLAHPGDAGSIGGRRAYWQSCSRTRPNCNSSIPTAGGPATW